MQRYTRPRRYAQCVFGSWIDNSVCGWYFTGSKLAGKFAPEIAAATKWGDASLLDEHFLKHGAENVGEYAQLELASDLFVNGVRTGDLDAVIDSSGVIRVYDRGSNAFAAYNPDGTR